MEREKSNSLTQLVKIVAREVAKEELTLHCTLQPHVSGLSITELGKQCLNDVKSSLASAGASWTKSEDELLFEEVRIAIAQIAKNHNRSMGAIKERIIDKDNIRRACY